MKWFAVVVDTEGTHVEGEDVTKGVTEIQSDIPSISIIAASFGHVAFMEAGVPGAATSDPNVFQYESFVLVGDIRIDNRFELLENLSEGNKEIMDELLMIRLWMKYGKEGIAKVVGEFSFVIWDAEQQILFAARDQLGVKTLFWYKQGHRIWVASDLECLQGIFSTAEVNLEYFVDFYKLDGVMDDERTPYRSVFRVPSSSWLHVSDGQVHVENYWQLEKWGTSIHYRTQAEYDEQFRELFRRAIRSRLKSTGGNSVMMSGGLDSTAIYTMALQLERQESKAETLAVCGVFDRYSECDEREFFEPLLLRYGKKGIYETCDDHGLLDGFQEETPFTFEPVVNSLTYRFTSSLMKRAHLSGARNILTGYAGDHVLSGSPALLGDLLVKRQLRQLLYNVYQFGLKTGLSVPQILWEFAITPQWKKRNKAGLSFHQQELLRQVKGTKANIYMNRVIAPRAGVTCAHPFLDRPLIEFLFSLPGDQLWKGGNTKQLLRRAMAKDMPDVILQRNNKTGHLPITYDGLRRNWSALFDVLSKGHVCQLQLISQTEWISTLHKWRQGMNTRDDIFVLVALELWFYRFEQKFGASILS